MSPSRDHKPPEVLHASAVAIDTRGLLILGASGTGKSSLALQLIALGATLVADDRVVASPGPEGDLLLTAPDAIKGRIEARGVGLLTLPTTYARAALAVDLDQTEDARLPEPRAIVIAGVQLPLVARVESPAFPSILHTCLKTGTLGR